MLVLVLVLPLEVPSACEVEDPLERATALSPHGVEPAEAWERDDALLLALDWENPFSWVFVLVLELVELLEWLVVELLEPLLVELLELL